MNSASRRAKKGKKMPYTMRGSIVETLTITWRLALRIVAFENVVRVDARSVAVLAKSYNV